MIKAVLKQIKTLIKIVVIEMSNFHKKYQIQQKPEKSIIVHQYLKNPDFHHTKYLLLIFKA